MTDPFAQKTLRDRLLNNVSIEEMLQGFAKKNAEMEAERRTQYPDFYRLAGQLRSGFTDFERDWVSEDAEGDDYDIDLQLELPLWDSNSHTSEVKDSENEEHLVAIDVDMDAALVPSTTPGHFHLLIDHKLPWAAYSKLLHALMEAGIIQEGYYNASIERGHTRLRTPWTKKPEPEEPVPFESEPETFQLHNMPGTPPIDVVTQSPVSPDA
jgi:hypothetical protein